MERVYERLGEAEAIKIFQFTYLSNGRDGAVTRAAARVFLEEERPACPGVK